MVEFNYGCIISILIYDKSLTAKCFSSSQEKSHSGIFVYIYIFSYSCCPDVHVSLNLYSNKSPELKPRTAADEPEVHQEAWRRTGGCRSSRTNHSWSSGQYLSELSGQALIFWILLPSELRPTVDHSMVRDFRIICSTPDELMDMGGLAERLWVNSTLSIHIKTRDLAWNIKKSYIFFLFRQATQIKGRRWGCIFLSFGPGACRLYMWWFLVYKD